MANHRLKPTLENNKGYAELRKFQINSTPNKSHPNRSSEIDKRRKKALDEYEARREQAQLDALIDDYQESRYD